MRRDFSNFSKDMLTELFPILLEEHDPEWKEYFLLEKDFLYSVFKDKIIRISHIGSTCVDGLVAKPTLDILLEVSGDVDFPAVTEVMKDNGYIVNTPENDIVMYLKGYTPQGFKGRAVHIHVRKSGDWGELYFRDYLISHPTVANEYAKLKLTLKDKYSFDRDGYTEAKGEFVRKYTELARAEFPDKYNPAAKAGSCRIPAYCGIFCEECKNYMQNMNCKGCGNETVLLDDCPTRVCAAARKLLHCGECGDFPCNELNGFYNDGSPLHLSAYKNIQNTIKEKNKDKNE